MMRRLAMLLTEVRIKNFRSLKNVTVPLDDNTIIIGENNSGKTSFLEALRFVLSRTTQKIIFDEYDYFLSDEITSPKESSGINITMIFRERTPEEWFGYIMDNFAEIVQYLGNETEYASIILNVLSAYNVATNEYETKITFLNKDFEVLPKGQNKVSSFIKLTPLFYLQALRDIKDAYSSKSPLWGQFLKKVNIPSDKMSELQSGIESINKEIVESDINLTKLLNSIEEIQRVLDFQGNDFVSINALPIKSWDLLSKAQLVLKNKDAITNFPIDRHGQGTQSISVILLFKAYINILLEEMNSTEAEAILTLEEPESHLHPQAVRAIARVINEINCQKIITTHSPYFIQNSNLLNLRIFRKDGNLTNVLQLKNNVTFDLSTINAGLKRVVEIYPKVFLLDEEKKRLIAKEPIDSHITRCILGCCSDELGIENFIAESNSVFSETELYELNTYMQKSRGELLFARKWIMFEGQTEEVIIPYCAELLGYNLDEYGISCINYRSNGSAKSFVKLAKVLGFKWIILGDNDAQGEATKSEVKKCGYSDEEIRKLVILTNEKDIEHEFVNCGFLTDYESALESQIGQEILDLKNNGDLQGYTNKIIELIQKGKVINAYLIVDVWKKRGMTADELPQFIIDFIKGVCTDGQH
jgi:putative ATP-dependent endonuclease of OLD family